jgi:hypothetical protein
VANPTHYALRQPKMPQLRAERGRKSAYNLENTTKGNAMPEITCVHGSAGEQGQKVDEEHLQGPDPGGIGWADIEMADVVLLEESIAFVH